MITIITEISKYLMMILFACYTYESFSALQRSGSPKRVQPILRRQLMFLFLIHLDAYLVIFAATGEVQMLGFYAMQVLLICAILAMTGKIVDRQKEYGVMLYGCGALVWLRGMYFLVEYLGLSWGWIK